VKKIVTEEEEEVSNACRGEGSAVGPLLALRARCRAALRCQYYANLYTAS
jgi:hypothetical protein